MGFEDKLRLLSIVMDELRPVKELPIKGCRDCRFSTGGQYFAAANGTTIAIYNTYTLENVGNLRGHHGKVRLRRRRAGRWGACAAAAAFAGALWPAAACAPSPSSCSLAAAAPVSPPSQSSSITR